MLNFYNYLAIAIHSFVKIFFPHLTKIIMMKKLIFSAILMLMCLLWLPAMLQANNVIVSNLGLTGKNIANHYIMVRFDIGWDNSWRVTTAPNNWDAAWVFVKYRIPVDKGGDGLWKHARLSNTGHNAPAGSAITTGLLDPSAAFNAAANPGIGAFIFRDAAGTGPFSKTGVQLRWEYGANAVADDDEVEFRVDAIEMVYVPQGAFALGSGGNEPGSFTNGSWASGATIPLSITSENELAVSNTAGNLWYTFTSTDIGDRSGPIPAPFPKGYNAIYCMKYEISQQQYVDFLNTLTYGQQASRTGTAPNSAAGTYLLDAYRHKIKICVPGTDNTVPALYMTDYPYVACNYVSWADLAAYLDWSGLRPMTELEFEKACRGTLSPAANEYAWGSATINMNTGITNPGENNEMSANNGNSNANRSPTPEGAMRTGAFATSTTSREGAGATYYGIMEMTGNALERPVSTGNATGRAFTGAHGNGTLEANGNADATAWPGENSLGSGFRGGCFDNTYQNDLLVSDRLNAAIEYPSRSQSTGGRGARGLFFTAGSILAAGETICYNGDPVVIGNSVAASGSDGTIAYQWQSSTAADFASPVNISANTASYDPATGLQVTTWYRRQAKDGNYNTGWNTSFGVWLVTVRPNFTAGSIATTGETICYNSDPVAIGNSVAASGGDGNIAYQWQSSTTSDFASPTAISANTVSYDPPSGVQVTTWYRRQAHDGSCNTGWNTASGVWLVTVRPNFTAGSILTTGEAICLNGNPVVIGNSAAASGGDGNIAYQWQSSTTADFASPTNISANAASYDPPAGLQVTTWYRRQAHDGTCSTGWNTSTGVWLIAVGTFTINHLTTNGVAPVDKTVTYGTKDNIPGEPAKCWITRNLGASQQAAGPNDQTEPSAGWYWQFNRKQGYTRGPNPAWTITSIDENSDWAAANNPCSLELGDAWRIPTYTEWYNVDAGGNWSNYNGPFNALNISVAGTLTATIGSTSFNGFLYSSTQASTVAGWYIMFTSSQCSMNNGTPGGKARGIPLRCLRD